MSKDPTFSDAEGFAPDGSSGPLGARTARAGAITVASQGFRFLIARDFYRTASPAIFAATAVLVALAGLRILLGTVAPITGLMAAAVCAALVAGIVLLSLPSGRRALRDFHQTGRLLRAST